MTFQPEYVPPHTPTHTLDRQIAEARREMGPDRWAELNAEWEAPVPHISNQAVSQWRGGVR